MAVLEQLPPAMKGRTAGATIVRDVRVEFQPDSFGEDAAFIIVVLSDPPAGQDAWPVADLRAIRQSLREYIQSRAPDLPIPWFVVFEPEHPDLDDSEDEHGQLGFDVD